MMTLALVPLTELLLTALIAGALGGIAMEGVLWIIGRGAGPRQT